jgi:hypothetical protein
MLSDSLKYILDTCIMMTMMMLMIRRYQVKNDMCNGAGLHDLNDTDYSSSIGATTLGGFWPAY